MRGRSCRRDFVTRSIGVRLGVVRIDALAYLQRCHQAATDNASVVAAETSKEGPGAIGRRLRINGGFDALHLVFFVETRLEQMSD